MSPLVSVCVPSFNNADHIAAAIRSVLVQQLSDFELIVVDDCSTDETVEIVHRCRDSRLRVLVNPRNLGPAGNWNRAVSQASGRYVKVLCGDDLLYPACLERQVAALESSPTAVMACAKRDIIGNGGELLLRGRGLKGLSGHVPGRVAIRRTVQAGTNIFGEPAAVMLRAAALRRAGGFKTTADYVLDLELWCRLLEYGDLWAIPQVLCAFRVQPRSWSHALSRQQSAQARALLADLRRRQPDWMHRTDAFRGPLTASALGLARRTSYRLLAGGVPAWRGRAGGSTSGALVGGEL